MPKIRHPNRVGKCYRIYCVLYGRYRLDSDGLSHEYILPDLWGKTVLVINTVQWFSLQLEILVSKPNGESEILFVSEDSFAEMHAYRRIKQIR